MSERTLQKHTGNLKTLLEAQRLKADLKEAKAKTAASRPTSMTAMESSSSSRSGIAARRPRVIAATVTARTAADEDVDSAGDDNEDENDSDDEDNDVVEDLMDEDD